MRNKFVILLLLGIVLSACGSGNTEIGERIPFPEEWIETTENLNIRIYEAVEAISPDGRWLVDVSHTTNSEGANITQTHIIPLSSPNMELLKPETQFLGDYQSPLGWSPDNAAIVVRAADKARAGCGFVRVIIYRIDPTSEALTQHFFEPYENRGMIGCIESSWSPDGSMLAVNLRNRNSDEIFILDYQANLLQTIHIDKNDTAHIGGLKWLRSGELSYATSDYEDHENPKHEVHLIRIDESLQDNVILKGSVPIRIVGSSKNPSRVFVSDSGESPYKKVTWMVINTVTNEIEQTFEMCAGKGEPSEAPQKEVLAFTGRPSDTGNGDDCDAAENTFLWVYNWKTEELVNYGEVDTLLGWSEVYEGFVVIEALEEEGDERPVVIIKP